MVERSVLFLAGNGLSIDLRHRLEPQLALWDTQNPLQWPIHHPRYGRDLRELFPRAQAALAALPAANDFERIRQVLALESDEPSMAVVELRHHLAMAFSAYQLRLNEVSELADWTWSRYIALTAEELSCVVSLNYDLLVERLVRLAKHRCVTPGVQPGWFTSNILALHPLPSVTLIKPHGSIDYGPMEDHLVIPGVEYPLLGFADKNNVGLRHLLINEWLTPRQEADLVLPTEVSPYQTFQWIKPGLAWLRARRRDFRKCVIVGVSYQECDQAELNEILDLLEPGTTTIVANPTPPPALLHYLSARDLRVRVWRDGPED